MAKDLNHLRPVEDSRMAITLFREKHLFLSPRSRTKVELDGLLFRSVEAAYQASKTQDRDLRKLIQQLNGAEACQVGKLIKPWKGWYQQRVVIMGEFLWQKFGQDPDRCRLLETDDEEIIRENDWGDTFWGVCKGVGENLYGKLLMDIRDECWMWDWQPSVEETGKKRKPSAPLESSPNVIEVIRPEGPLAPPPAGLRRGENLRHRTATSRRAGGASVSDLAERLRQQQSQRLRPNLGFVQDMSALNLRLPEQYRGASLESEFIPERNAANVYLRSGGSRALLCQIEGNVLATLNQETFAGYLQNALNQL